MNQGRPTSAMRAFIYSDKKIKGGVVLRVKSYDRQGRKTDERRVLLSYGDVICLAKDLFSLLGDEFSRLQQETVNQVLDESTP